LIDAERVGRSVKPLRVWLVGFGTVGRWLVHALDTEAERLARRYGIGLTVVGLANARDGFIYDPIGLDLRSVSERVAGGGSLADQPGARCWPSAVEGLRATDADVLVEVTASPSSDGEPGFSHMRDFVRHPPRMAEGKPYEDALAEARGAGLAERDPAADVEGDDAVAKLMILSALVFGRQLRREQVGCRGITDIAVSEIDHAASTGARLKHVATLDFSGPDGAGEVTARVEPELVRDADPLAHIDGTTNALACRATPIGEVMIIGPGAGPQLAGQGVFSDLIAVARSDSVR
jgi:homoserine dehydrogenase